MISIHFSHIKNALLIFFFCFLFFIPVVIHAATLSVSPSTGVYSSGQTFSVSVILNTVGQKVNAAEGTLSFNPSELAVVAVSKGSLFNLWTADPTFSNSAGTVSFSGGSPSGYTGSAGQVITVSFRSLGSGTPKVSFKNGAVLASDGRGTNVLSGMNSGTYTISAQSTTPVPERVIEYVAPKNAPSAPVVTSASHPNQASWYSNNTAELSWSLPLDVTGVRTLLDRNSTSVPTRVYETPMNLITLEDLDEGISYFHIQFRNGDGWGRVTHYRLAVDTVSPAGFVLTLPGDADLTSPIQTLEYSINDSTSEVRRFLITIDGGEPIEFQDTEALGVLSLPGLLPGYHTVIVEAFDEAGNSTISSLSFTILAFDKPVFTEYPSTVSADVIPVIKGRTRPSAKVAVTVTQIGLGVSSAEATRTYEMQSDAEGVFIVIPDGRLSYGVYELVARATDQYGAMSEPSESIRIIVSEPGYIRLGTYAINVLSIIVPLIAMSALLIIFVWFTLVRMRKMRVGVAFESKEAHDILVREFGSLQNLLTKERATIEQSRKTQKLTKAEQELIDTLSQALKESEKRVQKEIDDVSDIVD